MHVENHVTRHPSTVHFHKARSGDCRLHMKDMDEEIVRVVCVGPFLLLFFYYLINVDITSLPNVKGYVDLVEMLESHSFTLLTIPVCK